MAYTLLAIALITPIAPSIIVYGAILYLKIKEKFKNERK